MFKMLLTLCAITATLPCGAQARDEIAGPVTAEILRVVDGDTILVQARPWPQQTMEVYVRIRGIDAPEIHSRCSSIRAGGEEAQHALEDMITASPKVQLTRISGDKYFGRIVADVTLSDGRSIGNDLLLSGLARPYDGGRKPREICDAE
ncbi:thermonuclease family protein [Neorhizobium lilium]|uniref:Thermonuclease family protein n=1 Tax=Neorhizobium lilium TaxID=2503024 RepID=A0A444LAE5_9HYPH|nr:thermonuclease family protein [Neorhizobium lilium]RWX74558.1 thermonuclease family protein [Neorhizobium lilium]